MNIEQFREYCLSFADVTEKMPFGKFARRYESLLVFYVLNHMFCIIDIDDFTFVNVKSTAADIRLLRQSHTDISIPVNRAMRDWICLPLNGSFSEAEILELIRNSYTLIRQKHSPKATKKAKTQD